MKLKLILIALVIVPVFCGAQNKNDIFIYASQFISGCADGVNQSIIHHELGRGTSFWDYENSWKNKYKNFDKGDTRPAFLGSTTFAVGLTDGFHLTRLVDRAFSLGSIGFAMGEKQSFKSIVKKLIISSLINRAGFVLFFNVIYPGAR
jgi:hypothetical protein